ncbi:MAG: cyclophilin-like fold protein [Candidatus Latescibacterota bacterium]|nr:cyclophilin-like fold protein [Candidatus Latescibacterota bacterium]
MTRIHLRWPDGEVYAELHDTLTTRALMQALPLCARANIWGDEVYFDTGIAVELEEDARQVVDPGTVCFWVEGKSLALPYGPTPMSQGNECRLVSDVNILGQLEEDARILASICAGDEVRVQSA